MTTAWLPGDVLANRFEIKRRAGAGGSAAVFLARDRLTSQPVAVKILSDDDPAATERFVREAQVLSRLSHHAIVRYVLSGQTPDGRPFLVMEWIEGMDLAERISRARLSISESYVLLERMAEALATVHRTGLVHRDLKPSNICLPGGQVERAKLVDFGIVRSAEMSRLTQAGMQVGTPAYMSPEQIANDGEVTAASDIFSLGVVIYEALAGMPPFRAESLMTLLQMVLSEPASPLERSDCPPAFALLVGRMLAKTPAQRPADGEALLREVHALGIVATPARAFAVLTRDEQQMVTLAALRKESSPALAALVSATGASLQTLNDGTQLLLFSGQQAATDLTAQGARVALALRAVALGKPIALVTGRALLKDLAATGSAIDEVLRLLAAAEERDRGDEEDDDDTTSVIFTDDATASLLGSGFEIRSRGPWLMLAAEREPRDDARTLLGRPLPCVARDAELSTLDALYSACAADNEARVAIVIAAAGVGKSRLRHEFSRRMQARADGAGLWLARCEAQSAGTPFGVLAEVLRQAIGLIASEAPEVHERKLRARLALGVSAQERERVGDFLSEMLGLTIASSVQVSSARHDPMLMADQMQRAWLDWIMAEATAAPVVVMIEDMHWGDAPSAAALDAALHACREKPLFVLATARPELEQLFPRLWEERSPHLIRLSELSARACDKLVREVLKGANDTTVLRIVQRAGGNALYLEELIRYEAEGRADEMPSTIVAMVQARLERLENEARRLLRAASIMGEAFSAAALHALLGEAETGRIEEWLETLTTREVLVRRRELDSGVYAFRHDMVREAAYRMLTPQDRQLGHKLAAEWLTTRKDSDARRLAEHWEQAGEHARAALQYRVAAEHALGGKDLAGVLECATRGVLCGAADILLGELRTLAAEAHNWRGEFAPAEALGSQALDLLLPGTDAWLGALGETATAAGVQGHSAVLVDLHRRLSPHLSQERSHILAATRLAEPLIILGLLELADNVLALPAAHGDALADSDPGLAARIFSVLGLRRRFSGDAGQHLALVDRAVACLERAGDVRQSCQKLERAGYARLEIGDNRAAVRLLRAAKVAAEGLGLSNVAATARHNLGMALARLGELDEAQSVEREAIAAFSALGNRRMEGASLEYLALIQLDAGDPTNAQDAARQALAVASAEPPLPLNRAESHAILARAFLAQARMQEAFSEADTAWQELVALGGIDDGEALIRLTYAESMHGVGKQSEARAAIGAAAERLQARAALILDAQIRESFLCEVPENARTLALAHAWSRS